MTDIRRSIALAISTLMVVPSVGMAQNSAQPDSPHGKSERNQVVRTSETWPRTISQANLSAVEISSGGVVQSGPAGTIVRQTPSVSISCLRPRLVGVLRRASLHFGSAAIVTSGYRPGRRSYHGKCMAADVQIAGVSPGTLARYFKAQPGVGGVGSYGHTRSVHVDVAERKFNWHGKKKRRRVASAQ
jgi:uncharacterized protein YcbK (DUF882 family)